MTSDLDICWAATLLKKQQGDETPIHRALRVDEGAQRLTWSVGTDECTKAKRLQNR